MVLTKGNWSRLGRAFSSDNYFYHKSHVEWTGIEPSPTWFQASDWPPEPNI